jgi:predicted ATPase/class 3 adenylate cyclase
MAEPTGIVTFLFTDIEGSSQLWERAPERMRPALARHDGLARAAVERNHGTIVKTTGDGIHAYFVDPVDAIRAATDLQQALAEVSSSDELTLNVRCGIHAGVDERRDGDFFGPEVNRAARLMSIAHGGQTLVSQAVASLVRDRLPKGTTLRELGSVKLRSLTTPERVYQVTHAQLRSDFPALRTVHGTPNNLAPQLTSFIGRERELAAALDLFASTRLLTLVGAGGIGKTRLSLELAEHLLDQFPDGVWVVELAPLTDPQLVTHALATALGVKEQAGRSVQEAVLDHMRERRLLLVLDNCEHLIDACADLAKQLLQGGPEVRIIASSREALRVPGETTYPVPVLSVPGRHEMHEPGQLANFESVQLLVDRVRAANPRFALTADNAASVAEVCRRLDGIPLAIELAAARARSLSIDAIASRLNDRFKLLTRGDRTALPRQQTLRALIDWSHDLLTDGERAVLRRLAVFAGSFTPEAAEAVAASDAVDVLDELSALVEKSLVSLDPASGRYRLLDSVRQYAQERLEQSGEDETVRDRHLDYYVALAAEARAGLAGPDQTQWLARLDVEAENVLAAHAWCDRAQKGAELGLELAHSTKLYWFNRGLLALGQRFTVEAVARTKASDRTLLRCRGLFGAGQFLVHMGRYDEGKAFLEESLAIARELHDNVRIAAVLQPLGMAALAQGDFEGARSYLEEAVALARAQGVKREIAAAVNLLASLLRMTGEAGSAEPLYLEVLDLARALGDDESASFGLLNLTMIAIAGGRLARARTMLLEALDLAERVGSVFAGTSVIDVAAGLAAAEEEWDRAAALFGVAEKQASRTGLHRHAADQAFVTPLMERARAAMGAAAFEASADRGRTMAYERALEDTRAWLEGCSVQPGAAR